MNRRKLSNWMIAMLIALASSLAVAAEFTDDFSDGINPDHWDLLSNQPLFTCDDSGGHIFFSKPQGGSGFGYEFIALCLNAQPLGDFDVSVEFFDAEIEPTTGTNAVNLEIGFGSQYLNFGRTADPGYGHVVGVWEDPPGDWPDSWHSQPETATSGILRITRVGTDVSVFFNDQLVYGETYNAGPVTHLCFALANNWSTDATSVHFDNFTLTADGYGPRYKVAQLNASNGDDRDEFGTAVAVSETTAVVGAPCPYPSCIDSFVYVFERGSGDPTDWVESTVISNPPNTPRFGESVAIFGDIVAVGAHLADDGAGRVFIYGRDQGGVGNWGLITELAVATPSVVSFPKHMSLEGDTLVASAADIPGNAGVAYVFQQNQGGPNNWGQVAEIIGSDTAAHDHFGYQGVAISGDTLAVSAYRDDDASPGNPSCDSGSVYFFERNNGGPNNWGQSAKITADDGQCEDYFGSVLAFDGDTVVVATHASILTIIAKVYFFDRDHGGVGNWGEVVQHEGWGYYASSLSIHGDEALVGVAPWLHWGGSVEVLHRNQGGADNWGVVSALSNRGNYGDRFGVATAIGRRFYLVGAFKDDDLGEDSGSVFVFRMELFVDGFESGDTSAWSGTQ